MLVGTVKIYDGTRLDRRAAGRLRPRPDRRDPRLPERVGAPATMLIHFAPGASREGYFEGLAEFGRSGRPSDDEMADFYARHDNTWI